MRRQTARLSQWVATLLSFPEQSLSDGWGVLLDLSLEGAKLQTRSPLSASQELFLSFSLADQHFNRLHAQVSHVRRDSEGYTVCGLRFKEMLERQTLKDALVGVLTK